MKSGKRLLSIECSSHTFSLAVTEGEETAASRELVLNKVLSSSIIPQIDRILARSRFRLQDMDALAVGLGPGSFTSLRVGLATAKGLALATNKPVVGVASLDVLAMNAAAEKRTVCCLNDARRDMAYACLYAMRRGRPHRKSAYFLTRIEDLVVQCEGEVFFIGNGVPVFRERILRESQRLGFRPFFAVPGECAPSAEKLAVLALEKVSKGKSTNPDRLVPLYLYPADCQVNPRRKTL